MPPDNIRNQMINNKSFKNNAKFKYLLMTVTNKNVISRKTRTL